jgi:hypothetical protein
MQKHGRNSQTATKNQNGRQLQQKAPLAIVAHRNAFSFKKNQRHGPQPPA